jgi:hypothetical protein
MTVRERTTPNSEFDDLDPIEKTGIEAALKRCRALAAQIESDLRNKRREHFVDKLSFAPLLRRLPMSSERKADGRPRPHLLPW